MSEEMVRLGDGFDRFVVRAGAGEEVLIGLHGGPGASLETLRPLTEIADDGLQVVLYDQLGGGRSSRPEDDALWTVETFVAEFAELVERLELGSVHLLGFSWGGMLALECALAHPGKVKSLVLCDTAASTAAIVAGYEELLDGAPQAARDAVATGHEFDQSGNDHSAVGEALLDLYATYIRRCQPFDLERSRREFLDVIGPVLDEFGPAFMKMWGPNEFVPNGVLSDWDVSHRLGEIEVPVLVSCGLYDLLTVSCHRQIVEGLRDVRWLILGQSSHCTFMEAERDVLLSAIRSFVRRVAAQDAGR